MINSNTKPVTTSRLHWILLAITMIILGVRLQLIYTFGNPTPYWDDWGFGHSFLMYLNSELDIQWLFGRINEHRLILSKIVNITLFNLNGRQWDLFLTMVLDAFLWSLIASWIMSIAIKNRDQVNCWAVFALVTLLWTFPLSLFNILSTIQTYLYFMILLAWVGFWLCCAKPFCFRWIIGMLLMVLICGTSGAGPFAPLSVACVNFFYIAFDKPNRRDYLITAISAAIISVFGLSLVLTQSLNSVGTSIVTISSFMTTLFKTLSWPNSQYTLPSIFFLMPIIILAFRIMKAPEHAGKLGQYVLLLSCFSIMLAISIAYARNWGEGLGPSQRYFEFLATYTLCSFIALLILQNKKHPKNNVFNTFMVSAWLLAFLTSFSFQIKVYESLLTENKELTPVQEHLVASYAITGNKKLFVGKKFREVPFPNSAFLAETIDKMKDADMLPYQLQAPSQTIPLDGGVFVYAGMPNPRNKYRTYENAIGSYNLRHGAQNAIGQYQSKIYYTDRPFVMIPYAGYVGFEGISLRLIGVETGEIVEIKPKYVSSSFANQWREQIVRAPKGGYRIVASDNSKALWVAIASPRSVGLLTYYSERLIKKGKSIWMYGLLLLFIILRGDLIKLLSVPAPDKVAKSSIS